MPTDYRYSFFDSFHASPTLNEVHDEDYLEQTVAPVFHSQMTAVPIVVDVASAVEENSGFKSVDEEAEDEDEGEVEDEEAFDEADEVVTEVANVTPCDRPRKGILKITGQGTISVKADSTVGFHIEVQTVDSTNPTLYLDVTQDECYFSYGGLPTADGCTLSSSARVELGEVYVTYPKGKDAAKLSEGQGPYKHWLWIDLVNGVLRYGRGYCTASLVLLQAALKKKEDKMLVYVDKW